MRHLRGFLRFWYDFLVGDRWELFVGPIVALTVAWVLSGAGLPAGLTGVLLFVGVSAVGALSVVMAIRP